MHRIYTTRINKIGNSLGVVLPKDILEALMWDRGDYVSFGVIAGPTLIVRQLSDGDLKRISPTREITY